MIIKVSKKPEDMTEQEHLKAAVKELQAKMKAKDKSEKFTFDVAAMEAKLKDKK